MAMHFALKVNGEPIGGFVAQRREAEIPASGVCTYDVRITYRGEIHKLIVYHNYADGGFALVHRALELLAKPR